MSALKRGIRHACKNPKGSQQRVGMPLTRDMRSPAAKARDEWLDSPEGTSAQNAATLGSAAPNYYLRNRLERAFLAGMEAARRLQGNKGHTEALCNGGTPP